MSVNDEGNDDGGEGREGHDKNVNQDNHGQIPLHEKREVFVENGKHGAEFPANHFRVGKFMLAGILADAQNIGVGIV